MPAEFAHHAVTELVGVRFDRRADIAQPRAGLRRRDAEGAAEWTRKHMVDFQRGFAMAGLSMRTPIAQPT